MKNNLIASYDQIAEKYDSLFDNQADKSIEFNLMYKLNIWQYDSVLDVGCGTGALLDYFTCSDYLGIDPSIKMLERFEVKHPGHNAIQLKFESLVTTKKYSFVLALFGSFSYINPKELIRVQAMLEPNGQAFIMVYKQGYTPATYVKTGISVSHYSEAAYMKVVNIMHNASVEYFDNYLIIRLSHENFY